MKGLMNIMKFKTSLKESLLDDIDVVSDKINLENIYPIPTAKEFDHVYRGRYASWDCKELIQQYIGILDEPDRDLKSVTGIGVLISRDKFISTYLITKYDDYHMQINGCGDWVSNNLQKSIATCIYFFRKLIEDPDKYFPIIFNYHNKCNEELEETGSYDFKTYPELFDK